ncbi:MAG TPA: hypothetical protein VML50_03185 [Anaeromyxobacter sp.]|nr:hypothetical protein [Anaeromyxobacter sp.]
MSDTGCPMCHDGRLERSEGRLDQSGESYLPTVMWRCARCEYTRLEPALHARWIAAAPAEAPAPRSLVAA